MEQDPGLGERLLADYDSKLDEVLENPELYQLRDEDGLRRANLNTVSYSIRFDWDGSVVTVIALAHHFQDTARWVGRLAALLPK